METFLKPLTAKEEKQYLEAYQGGSKEAKDILVERNLRLVAHVVKKYQGKQEELDDLISIGTIGLLKAVATYDTKKGSRLASYAARCIENELLMYFRAKKKTTREVSLYEPIGTDKEGNEIHLMDVLEDHQEDIVAGFVRQEEISRLLASQYDVLNNKEQKVLQLRYGLLGMEPCTQREIAEQLGISRSYVSRIEKNAIGKLRACLEQEFS